LRIWKDNIEIEVDYENWRGIQLVQDRVQKRGFISEVLNDHLTFADKLLK